MGMLVEKDSLPRPARAEQYDLGEVIVHAPELLNDSSIISMFIASAWDLQAPGVSYLIAGRPRALLAGSRGAPRPRHNVGCGGVSSYLSVASSSLPRGSECLLGKWAARIRPSGVAKSRLVGRPKVR
jgi:hypothetical protein